jgi:hypothetical protein
MRWSVLPIGLQANVEQDILDSLGNEAVDPSEELWVGPKWLLSRETAFDFLLRGCAALDYKWQTNQPVRERVFATFSQSFHSGSNFTTTCISLRRIGLKWNDLPVEVQDSVFERIKSESSLNALFLLEGLINKHTPM